MKDFFYDLFHSRNFRIIVFWIGLCLLFFCALDCYFESCGLPEATLAEIRDAFAAKGYRFKAESVRAGAFKGVRLRNLSITGSSTQISLKAESAVLRLSFREFFKGTRLPLLLRIDNGVLTLPVFPELGEEAKTDRIVFTDLSAVIYGVPGLVRVHAAEARFNGMLFRVQGDVDNLLHFSRIKGMELLKSYFSNDYPDSEKTPENEEYITQVPVRIRQMFMIALNKIERMNFNGETVCDVFFKWDMTDFRKCVAEMCVNIPAFSYGNLNIRSIREKIFLKNGGISINPIRLELPGDSWLEASARYLDSGSRVDGSFTASCGIHEILLFFPEPAQSIIRSKLGEMPSKVLLKGALSEFNPAAGTFGGKLLIKIPHLTVSGVRLDNALFEIEASAGSFRGTLKNASLANGGSLSGTFEFDGRRFSSLIEGSASFRDARKFLSPEVNGIITNNMTQKKDMLIAFKGSLTNPDWKKTDFSGRFDVMIPGVSMKQIDVRRLTATLEFSPSSLRVIGMDALLADASHLRGDVFCNPLEETISANIVCTGNPEKIIASLGSEYRNFLRSATGEIVWPTEDHSIAATADLHFCYGKNPSHYMSGSLMLRNFSFRKIRFRYGGVRFVLRDDNTVLFPDIVLETGDGRMTLRGAYRQSEPFDPAKDLSGVLKFSMESTICGNDMIRCLYPDWSAEYISFPEKIRVDAEGTIDYGDLSKTVFTAQVMNGTSIWNNMPVRDIDLSLRYANDIFSFQRAEGMFCGGRFSLDYEYDSGKESGKLRLHLKNADFNEFLRLNGFAAVTDKKNSFSTQMEGNFSYTEKDELLLNGNASFELTGTELWLIPILGPFMRVIGDAWSLDSLGAITKISGGVLFNKDTMTIDRFQSDGGVVSIGAKGYYKWTPGDFDITLQAILLKNTLPFNAMSKLLQPVSWMLKRRFKGNVATYDWTEIKK